jgi:cobalt-zinc-cadmium efflux system protein
MTAPESSRRSASAPGHAHAHVHLSASAGDSSKLVLALLLILVFMCAEVIAGVLGHSLALLSDAAHMLTDAGAIALAIVVARVARRPAQGAMTFGLRRLEVLSAQANGIALVILAALIGYESIRRLIDPVRVKGWLMLTVALAGVLVNLCIVWALARTGRRSLNIEGSFQHVLTDLYAFVGTAIAAGVILAAGFERADPIASLLITLVMLLAGYRLIRASARIFLEASPADIDPAIVGQALVAQPGVVEVHDLHVWELATDFPALSAHVLVGAETNCHATRRALERLLREQFGITHTTLQVDHSGAELVDIEPAAARQRVGSS